MKCPNNGQAIEIHTPSMLNQLLHLKFIHPLWMNLERCTTGGVWIFKCTYLLHDFWRGSKYFIQKLIWGFEFVCFNWNLHSPMLDVLKSSTGGALNLNWVTIMNYKGVWTSTWKCPISQSIWKVHSLGGQLLQSLPRRMCAL